MLGLSISAPVSGPARPRQYYVQGPCYFPGFPCIYLWVQVVIDNFGPARWNPVQLAPAGIKIYRRVTFREMVHVLKVGARDGEHHFIAKVTTGWREGFHTEQCNTVDSFSIMTSLWECLNE